MTNEKEIKMVGALLLRRGFPALAAALLGNPAGALVGATGGILADALGVPNDDNLLSNVAATANVGDVNGNLRRVEDQHADMLYTLATEQVKLDIAAVDAEAKIRLADASGGPFQRGARPFLVYAFAICLLIITTCYGIAIATGHEVKGFTDMMLLFAAVVPVITMYSKGRDDVKKAALTGVQPATWSEFLKR